MSQLATRVKLDWRIQEIEDYISTLTGFKGENAHSIEDSADMWRELRYHLRTLKSLCSYALDLTESNQ